MVRGRTLEIWHVPKRASLHQMIGAVNILDKLSIHGKKWPQNRKFFDQKFAMWGFTSRGRSLSKNASETFEALMKYLGLIIIQNDCIFLTNSGKQLVCEHNVNEPTKKKRRLNDTIKEMGNVSSKIITHQMFKLCITNPTISHYCTNIHLYPFRETLNLLLDTQIRYLTQEEIGYFLFHMKNPNERKTTKEKILHYRSLKESEKTKMINSYKQTSEGNLTLVQAPTATYWRQLCENTGLCFSENKSLKINNSKKSEIVSLLKIFPDKLYDYKNNSNLWLSYFGEPEIIHSPMDLNLVINGMTKNLLLIIKYNRKLLFMRIIDNPILTITLFPNLKYQIEIIDVISETNIFSINKEFTDSNDFIINLTNQKLKPANENYAQKIIELIHSKDYDNYYKQLIHVVSKRSGINYEDKKYRATRRGGRLEYLFFKLLEQLEIQGLISNLCWNGRIDGKTGFALPALGTQSGLPDLTFECGTMQYLLELTTIPGATAQWKAEGVSVPFHIRNFIEKTKNQNVQGIFCVPKTHQKVKDSLDSTRLPNHYNIIYTTIDDFLKILSKPNLENNLKSLS